MQIILLKINIRFYRKTGNAKNLVIEVYPMLWTTMISSVYETFKL